MGMGRLRAIISELQERVEKVQAAIDSRPVLEEAIKALRAKLDEAEEEAEAEDEQP